MIDRKFCPLAVSIFCRVRVSWHYISLSVLENAITCIYSNMYSMRMLQENESSPFFINWFMVSGLYVLADFNCMFQL